MNMRKIGTDEVSAIGLGCMGITHASGAPMSIEDGAKVIETAHDLGYTLFDTAECYTGVYPDGTTAYNEEVVGKGIKSFRNEIFLASKCGVQHGGDHLILDSSPETIRKSVEGSLKRLGTDHIDLYYQHRIDPKVEPETVAETMAALIKEGKIRYWGISETTEEYLRRAHAVCPVTAIQNRYSMMARWHETIFRACEELGVTYVAFSPLANGFLSGAYTDKTQFEPGADFRGNMPQYKGEGYQKGKALLDIIEALAAEKNVTTAQISLAWILSRKPYIIPIPGSRKTSRLKENLEAANVVLTKEESDSITEKLDGMEFDIFGGHK